MAPELSREFIESLPRRSRVIDPMCGSGTVVRQALEADHSCVGYDIDPLAVLMTRAWVMKVEPYRLVHDAHDIVDRARSLQLNPVVPVFRDQATDAFAHYWFAEDQRADLHRLAAVLRACRYRSRDLLKVCFSRLIVTKDRGASLARDVSHSRPHRVALDNGFDVLDEYLRAVRLVAKRLEPESVRGHATVRERDARCLSRRTEGLFDAALTSPPYLNAIDYLRGHRLSLIWFGYSLREIQSIRASSTGSERAVPESPIDVTPFIKTTRASALGDRHQGWVRRYATDLTLTLAGLRSIVRPGGEIVLVVGNSFIRGASVDNAGIIGTCAERAGLDFVASRERRIQARRRYLPPPRSGSSLAKRMRSESVMTFRVPPRRERTSSRRA